MSANELETQPTVAVDNEYVDVEDSSDDAPPGVKSGVRVDPNAQFIPPTPKYARKDTIHMSERIGGSKIKSVYQIYSSRYNQQRGFTEYQLMVPLTQVLYNKGEWYRERDLHRN